jgi:hypothetical protein
MMKIRLTRRSVTVPLGDSRCSEIWGRQRVIHCAVRRLKIKMHFRPGVLGRNTRWIDGSRTYIETFGISVPLLTLVNQRLPPRESSLSSDENSGNESSPKWVIAACVVFLKYLLHCSNSRFSSQHAASLCSDGFCILVSVSRSSWSKLITFRARPSNLLHAVIQHLPWKPPFRNAQK